MNPDRMSELTVRFATAELEPSAAVILTITVFAIFVVLTVNVALVLPAGTVKLLGTVAAALLLLSVIFAPPEGATMLSVTVPVDDCPPRTLVGFKVRPDTAGGVIYTLFVTLTPARLAVTLAIVASVTGVVVHTKLACIAPDAIVTELGQLNEEVLDLIETVRPLAGAFAEMATVPVVPFPPETFAGEKDSDTSLGA